MRESSERTSWLRNQYVVPGLLWLFATAWNLTKPFHMDDTVHLEIAQWIAGHPTHPMSGFIDGGDSMVPIWELNQPHLFFYLMAAVGKAFGWHEISMHALVALFTLGAIVFTYGIARRLEPDRAGYVTALAVGSPVFIVGQNVMVDVPLLAAVSGCYWSLLAYRGSDANRYLIAAMLASVAILIKYSAVVLIPALYLDMILRGQGKYWITGLVPLAALALWSVFNEWDYGQIHILTRPSVPGGWSGTLVERAVGLLFCIGACLPPLALAFRPAWPNAARRPYFRYGMEMLSALPLTLLVVAVLYLLTSVFDPLMYRIVKALLAISGIGVVFTTMTGSWAGWKGLRVSGPGKTEFWLLLYWAASFLGFVILFAPFMATRHVLPAIVPIVLLAGMGSGASLHRRAIVLAATAIWTSIVAAGDWWAAAAYRDAAAQVRQSLPAEARVWALGHWGWEWYARAAGMPGIHEAAGVREGDYVVWPVGTGLVALPQKLPLVKVGETVIGRTCCASYLAAGEAGWYTSGYWRLPWLPTRAPLDAVEIHRVAGNR